MFHEDLESPGRMRFKSFDKIMLRGDNNNSSNAKNTRKVSPQQVKRKPVGSAPSLPKLEFNGIGEEENLISTIEQLSPTKDRLVSSPKGPRPFYENSPKSKQESFDSPKSSQTLDSLSSITFDGPLSKIDVVQSPAKGTRLSSRVDRLDSPTTEVNLEKPLPPPKSPPIKRKPVLPPLPALPPFKTLSLNDPPPVPPKSPKTKSQLDSPVLPPKDDKHVWSGTTVSANVNGIANNGDGAHQKDLPERISSDSVFEEFEDSDDSEDENNELTAEESISDRYQDKPNDKHWKYHIMKYSKDLYLTTNPDHRHLLRRPGPSYYINIENLEGNDGSLKPFRLTFNTKESRLPVMTIVRNKLQHFQQEQHSNLVDCFDITIYEDKQSSFKAQAIQIQSKVHFPGRKKPTVCKQYKIRDESTAREWVVGNRVESKLVGKSKTIDGVEHLNDHVQYIVSSKIFFFTKAKNEKSDDTIYAVFRRRQPKRKRIVKESLNWLNKKAEDEDEQDEQDGTITLFGTSVEDDDANNEKVGWLYMLDAVSPAKNAVQDFPWIWLLVLGLTLSVGYSQRIDSKEEGVQQKFANFKRKANDVRKQITAKIKT